MATTTKPLKRKSSAEGSKKPHQSSTSFKKPKLNSGKALDKGTKKPFKVAATKDQKKTGNKDEHVDTKKEQRIRSKELTEARKKKRKKHYTLEQELALLWEKMRRRNISKEDRSKFVSEALQKMKGKISEIASSHVSSRVLQSCVKHCTQDERGAVFTELRPHFITLAGNTYAVHLVTKMLDSASKQQLAEFIGSLHGHVASLLRHMVGSLVIEQVYNLGNATQKQSLLAELYSPELQLFKDMVTMKETRLVDVISKLQLQKSSVVRHMTTVLQPILEKGIIDHSIIHRILMEYLTVADKSSAADVLEQLSGLELVRMMHTKDGSRLAILCIKYGSAKDRKKFIKGMKGHIEKIAHDRFGANVLACIFSVVDDTKLVTKIVIRELEKNLKELLLDQNGKRPLLQLLHPNSSTYFSPDDLASLSVSVPSITNKVDLDGSEAAKKEDDNGEDDNDLNTELKEGVKKNNGEGDNSDLNIELKEGGKKDPFKRRQELLVDSGLAEKIIDVCCETAGEMLRSKIGKDVICEVASGGADKILHPALDEKLGILHEAIASLAAAPKEEEPEEDEEEHVLEQFHSSRNIRKLVLDCPDFASVLWEKALKGKCSTWVKGHSSKVVKAFLESSNATVKALAEKELEPFIKKGELSLT